MSWLSFERSLGLRYLCPFLDPQSHHQALRTLDGLVCINIDELRPDVLFQVKSTHLRRGQVHEPR